MVRRKASRGDLTQKGVTEAQLTDVLHEEQLPASGALSECQPSETATSTTTSGSYGGFVVSACTHTAFMVYLIWAFLPDAFIQALGISWYPHRDWALLLPSWLTVLVASVYIGYAALNLYDTPALNSPAHLSDAFAQWQDPQAPSPGGSHPLVANSAVGLAEGAIPALYDMPLAVYNQIVFDCEQE